MAVARNARQAAQRVQKLDDLIAKVVEKDGLVNKQTASKLVWAAKKVFPKAKTSIQLSEAIARRRQQLVG